MLIAALRDLQWRRRRYLTAVLGAGLAFALGLVMSGLHNSFAWEINQTIAATGTDAWAVAPDSSNPFSAFSPVQATAAIEVEASAGIDEADPVVIVRHAIGTVDPVAVVLLGVVPGGVGAPAVDDGEPLGASGQIVVGDALERDVGETISMGGRSLTITGIVDDATLYAGLPVVWITLGDAQELAFGGETLASTVAWRGDPAAVPGALRGLTNAEVRDELLVQLGSPRDAIALMRIMLWVVAAIVMGSLFYLSALERTRDFAVFKATGVGTRSIAAGLALQAVVLSLVAAVIAEIVGTLLVPVFPMIIVIPGRSYLVLPVVACVVGILASLAGLRRAARVEPALAFGGP